MYRPVFAVDGERFIIHFLVYFPSVKIAVLLRVETIMAKSYNLCLPLAVDTSE